MGRDKPRAPRRRWDVAAIRMANPMPELAARLTTLRQRGREWIGCCPFHQDRTPSFSVWRGRGQHWRGHCFGCGWQGDVIDLACQAYGLSWRDAAAMLAQGLAEVTAPTMPMPATPDRPDRANDRHQRAAQAIFAQASAIDQTPAETYLRHRGLAPPWPADLRFAQLRYPNTDRLPCLVAGVRDPGGQVVAVQRIYLAPGGQGKAAVAQPKLSLGPIRGAAIHLREPAQSDCLVICEGPEDGLSLLAMLGLPVWVAAGAGNLAALEFPPGICSIVIGADNDATGRRAASKAAEAYAARGLHVRILYPLPAYKDFNAEWLGVRHGIAA